MDFSKDFGCNHKKNDNFHFTEPLQGNNNLG